MGKEIALAIGVLVVTAVAGMVVTLSGHTDAAEVIWAAGVLLSVCIAFSAPWSLHFFGKDEAGD